MPTADFRFSLWRALLLAAAVTRCDVTLHAVATNAGTLAADFHAFSILQATQTRSVRFSLR